MKKLPPKPIDILKELAAVPPGMFDRLGANYKLAWNMGYSAYRSGLGRRGGTPNGHSDPTGDTAADKEEVRKKVVFAGHKIMEAVAALDGADDALSEVTEWAGKYERVRHQAGESPAVTKEELQNVSHRRPMVKPSERL